ncbi:MAG: sensor histidine kinase [Rhodobacter sp.]|nr:sensor histidine kinase [Rhodobacter sp.]
MARSLVVSIFLICVAGLVATVWIYSLNGSIREIGNRGRSDLALASARLVSGLRGYRLLTAALARDPRLKSLETPLDETNEILLRAADLSGALDFVLLDGQRRLISSASGSLVFEWPDEDVVGRAMDGMLGRHVAYSKTFGRRVFLFGTPVFADTGPVMRVLISVIDLGRIEADFRGSRPAVFVSGDSGLIYFSNRSELVLRNRHTDDFFAQASAARSGGLLDTIMRGYLGADIWTVSAGRYLPRRALHVDQDLPVIGMRAEALVDIAPAIAKAWLQGAVAGFACLLFGAVIVLVSNQRRTLARTNEMLEGRVAARTRELSEANAALRVEVSDRLDAERALQRAQDDLVQAAKLSALGKMSAGISHELNQPLMAIRSFSENAATYLARGDRAKAESNLARVAELAARMARIIKNFRAFARQEKEIVGRVDLVQAITASVDLAESRMKTHDVVLNLDLPEHPIWVQGGEVRLQQVVLNLISNAIDAMVGTDPRVISISVAAGPPVVLIVRDTGPGIAEPDKVFEPFYSTKSIGEAEGVGLGLSISYGLVQSFGGNIRGANAPEGGAIFTVELQQWVGEATG